ncbi:MAG: AarF/ABC1/UbiB kinase family protein, partial [Anaerolineae bacterium]|nr:AarF/ABC1/UbiB kinase family protein [Anaerolineae bacterium]
KFNPNDVIREHVHWIMTRHMLKSVAPGKLFSSALELNEFVQELPGRINKVLDALVTREFELKIQALDETRLMNNIQKVANRITMGLVLAALIVGAALIMRIESAYTILGYPAVAIVLFLVAVGLGLALVFNIFIQDVWRKN